MTSVCLLTYTNETRQSTCHWGCAMANKEFRNSNEINAKVIIILKVLSS